ncbi:hypothetical protein QCE73_33910, partial [Caballeronia sp. LZ029]|nr:hypothetical protein [Caballeronia sp. LZ029]
RRHHATSSSSLDADHCLMVSAIAPSRCLPRVLTVIALQTDSQMVSRFTPFEVPRWRESEAFRRLLAAFERILPLRRPSDLAQKEIAQYVLAASGGLTGEVSRILNAAAEAGIRSGDECIKLEHLEHVAPTHIQ